MTEWAVPAGTLLPPDDEAVIANTHAVFVITSAGITEVGSDVTAG